MDKQFAHLHVHTEYSLLDGATRINKLFQKCHEMGMTAVAITDHGNMYGVLDFVKAAVSFTSPGADVYEFLADPESKFKVKPIIGCEFYMTDDMHIKTSSEGKMPKNNHLVLLAKNETGYKNLIKLVSLGYTEGLYYKPRIDFDLLKTHSEGLIALSACLAGIIPQCILQNDLERADVWAKKFKELFGEDFYIEIQDHNIKDQRAVLPHLIKIAAANGIKLVATNDVHYLNKKDALMQRVLQCIMFRKTIDNGGEDFGDDMSQDGVSDDGYFPTREFYLKSYDEMLSLFPNFPEALSNTMEIADKCECNFFKKEHLFPNYEPEDKSNPAEFLRRLTYDGLSRKYKSITPEIKERADYELGIIERLGFVEYFLIVWDFINFSENNGIPVGPGRGSGVGSIVAYAVGITKVDPLKYSLIFERFLNAERVSNPDFDIDFCVDRRDEVIQYVISKYGAQNVSQIITFGTLAAKAAVKDVGRVFNQPYSEVEKITKLIPFMMGKNKIGHLLGLTPTKDGSNAVIDELKEMYETNDMAKKILDMSMSIEGMPRQTGMHAAGVIICRDAIDEHIPMSKSGDGIVTTQFNMIECEEIGLLKMDFLGLRTLTDIKKAVDLVKKNRNVDIDFYSMEYDDQEVFKLIASGDTHAIFQLESEGMKRFMRDLRPNVFEDIIAGVALYRPGPMDKIGEYVHNKKNPDKIKYDHPLLEPILSVTYGITVYQEQVMEIVRKLAGYSLGRADQVRRMMSKKKKDQMEKERKVFLHGTNDKGVVITGCIANGVPEDVGNKVYDDMISFASYAFNKSHAAAYAFLSYQTAYLKRYYTVEFITAVLNNRITSIDEIRNYLSYLKNKNIEVLPPDINNSLGEFSVENGAVRIGLAAVKNVGASVVEEIIAERNANGKFEDFIRFVERMGKITLNKKMLESLIYAGAFDCFNIRRSQLIAVYESVLDRAAKDREAKVRGQFSFFDYMDDIKDEFVFPNIPEYSQTEKLQKEKAVAGIYLTGNPLSEYEEYLNSFSYNTSMFVLNGTEEENGMIINELNNKTVTLGGVLTEAERKHTKSGREIGLGKLEDLYGTIEVMLSGYKVTQYKDIWTKDAFVTVKGKLSYRDDTFSLWADSVEEWAQTKDSKTAKKMCIYLSFKNIGANVLDGINGIIAGFKGKDSIYIKNIDDNTIYPLETKVYACEGLRNELYGIEDIIDIKIA